MFHNNTPNIQLQVNIFKLLIHVDFQLLNTLGRRDSEVMYKLNKQKKKKSVQYFLNKLLEVTCSSVSLHTIEGRDVSLV